MEIWIWDGSSRQTDRDVDGEGKEEEEERDERIIVVDTLAALPDWEMTLNLLIHSPSMPLPLSSPM